MVCGGRDYGEFETTKGFVRDKLLVIDERKLFNYVLNWHKPSFIIHRAASGADRMAILWGDKFGVPHSGNTHTANWLEYGSAAGPIRNAEMLQKNKVDLVIAFEGGRGTANMVRQVREHGIEVIEPRLMELNAT